MPQHHSRVSPIIFPNHNFSGECKVCGDCCAVNVQITEPKKGAAIREILKKGDILREIGVDPALVVQHIRKSKEMPLRDDLGINEHPHGLTRMHCAVLVPDQVIKKQQ
jgi:hypothetical protein